MLALDARQRGWLEGVVIAGAAAVILFRVFRQRQQRPIHRAKSLAKVKSMKLEKTDDILGANFPVDKEGRTYHVGCKHGEIANRILTTGCPTRALQLSKYLDAPFVRASSRGFTVYTGLFKGTPVSIIASGMGLAMMDFCVREVRAVTTGPLVIVRLGSCGGVSVDAGCVCVADEAIVIQRDFDSFHKGEGDDGSSTASGALAFPYRFSAPIPADPVLTEHIVAVLQKELGASKVHLGLNLTADSFYSSQGRADPNFDDRNGGLLGRTPEGSLTLEMETGQLLHLAACSRESLIAGAVHMVYANRRTNYFLPNHDIAELEHLTGRAALLALCSFPLPAADAPNGGVWSRERRTSASPAAHYAHAAP